MKEYKYNINNIYQNFDKFLEQGKLINRFLQRHCTFFFYLTPRDKTALRLFAPQLGMQDEPEQRSCNCTK